MFARHKKIAASRLNFRRCTVRSRRHKVSVVFALSLIISAPGSADAASQTLVGSDLFTGMGFLFRTSVESGGEKLLSVNGADGDSASLTGGRGTSIELGIRLDLRPFNRPAFETELTLGMKTASVNAGSGSADFWHTTIALSQFYRFTSGLRIGAGVGMNLSSSLDVDIPGFSNTSTSPDATPEYRAMLEYGFAKHYAIGVRYRGTSWTSGSRSVDGSNAGVYLSVQTR